MNFLKIFFLFSLILLNFTQDTQSQDDDLTNLIDELIDRSKPGKEFVEATFKTTRIINAHSVETLNTKTLDFRVSHRFGDIASKEGERAHALFGFDNAADIFIGLEYGVTDDLTLGFGRNKGAGPLDELYHGHIKYRALKQTTDNKRPVSITIFANSAITARKKSADSTSVSSIPKWQHRFSYVVQAIIARKFSGKFSLEIIPTYLHRNFVPYGDENDNFAIAAAGRFKFTKRVAIILEFFYPISKYRFNEDYRNENLINYNYFMPIGIGFEFETGGHIFHVNFTNSEGILQNDFIPYTSKNWLDGGFRLGFTISRVFQLGKEKSEW